MSDQDSTAFNVVDKRTGSKDPLDVSADQDVPTEAGSTEPAASESESKPDSDETTSESAPATDEFDERSLPDPSFLLNMATMQMEARALLQALIPVFDGYAWRSMGFVADPKTGDTNKDMASAQLAIDTVQFLLSKIEAQLSETERRDTHRRLSDLRMNYITKLRES
jgi:hypothetical protein